MNDRWLGQKPAEVDLANSAIVTGWRCPGRDDPAGAALADHAFLQLPRLARPALPQPPVLGSARALLAAKKLSSGGTLPVAKTFLSRTTKCRTHAELIAAARLEWLGHQALAANDRKSFLLSRVSRELAVKRRDKFLPSRAAGERLTEFP